MLPGFSQDAAALFLEGESLGSLSFFCFWDRRDADLRRRLLPWPHAITCMQYLKCTYCLYRVVRWSQVVVLYSHALPNYYCTTVVVLLDVLSVVSLWHTFLRD